MLSFRTWLKGEIGGGERSNKSFTTLDNSNSPVD